MKRPGKGFTLVELLVVIAIIAVLAALITSVSMRMVKSGRSAKDLAQLKDTGVGILSYANDNGRYPLSHQALNGGYYWMDHIRADAGWPSETSDSFSPEHAEPFMSKRLNVRIPAGTSSVDIRRLKHYAAVEALMPWRSDGNGYYGVPLTSVKRPGSTALLVSAAKPKEQNEMLNSHINLWGPFRSRWFYGHAWPAADNPSNEDRKIDASDCKQHIDFRNNGKAHVLFADGHIETLGPNEFYYRMFTNAY